MPRTPVKDAADTNRPRLICQVHQPVHNAETFFYRFCSNAKVRLQRIQSGDLGGISCLVLLQQCLKSDVIHLKLQLLLLPSHSEFKMRKGGRPFFVNFRNFFPNSIVQMTCFKHDEGAQNIELICAIQSFDHREVMISIRT